MPHVVALALQTQTESDSLQTAQQPADALGAPPPDAAAAAPVDQEAGAPPPAAPRALPVDADGPVADGPDAAFIPPGTGVPCYLHLDHYLQS